MCRWLDSPATRKDVSSAFSASSARHPRQRRILHLPSSLFWVFSPEAHPQLVDSSSKRRSVAFQAAMPPFVGACFPGFPSHSTTTSSWHELCACLCVPALLSPNLLLFFTNFMLPSTVPLPWRAAQRI